jgi:F420-dependent oxidoreductase-like protein
MTAQTIDALAGGGRMRLGIGMSGPQVAEGWHGRPWGRPNYRLRDTVAILRKVWSGERVAHEGREIQLPYRGPGASGLGKPIRNAFSPVAPIPILIGAETPLNVRMTGEVADGLITFEGEPKQVAGWRALLEQGFERRGSRPEAFELYSSVRVLETDDVKAAIEAEKKGVAMYIGGFGASTINFHRDAMAAKGYPEAARRVQELFLAGRRDEAAGAVPDEYVDERMLIGPLARVRERFRPWRDSGFTTLAVRTASAEMLEVLAKENAV